MLHLQSTKIKQIFIYGAKLDKILTASEFKNWNDHMALWLLFVEEKFKILQEIEG